MKNSPYRKSNGISLRKLTAVGAMTLILTVWVQPVLASGSTASMDPEIVRQQILEFVALQEQAIDALEQLRPVPPSTRTTLQNHYQVVATMPVSQLQTFVDANVPMQEFNKELRIAVAELEWTIKNNGVPSDATSFKAGGSGPKQSMSGYAPAPITAAAPHWNTLVFDCPSNVSVGGRYRGSYVIPEFAFFRPPGHCHQADDIPISRNADGSVKEGAQYMLSDVGEYPYICPLNLPPVTVSVSEILLAITDALTRVLHLVCQDEKAGFNASLLCAPVIVTYQAILFIAEDIIQCNSERRDSERQTVYARIGETYVQSNAHYAAMNSLNGLIQTATNELETSVKKDVNAISTEITTGLNEGFGAIAAKADAVQLRIAENAAKVAAAKHNSDIIKYKIWCDQQPGRLKPPDCR